MIESLPSISSKTCLSIVAYFPTDSYSNRSLRELLVQGILPIN